MSLRPEVNRDRSPQSDSCSPPRGTHSLAWRLTLWYAASAFAIVAATTAFLYFAQVARFAREGDEFVDEHVKILRTILKDRPGDVAGMQQQIDFEAYEGIYIRVLDPSWKVVVESPRMDTSLPVSSFPRPVARGPANEKNFDLNPSGDRDFRAVVCGVPPEASAPLTHWLQIGYDRSEEAALLADFRGRAFPVLIIALVSCVALGHQIARRGLRPVHDISRTILSIRSSTLDERVDVARLPSELYELAATFNGMLDRLQGAFERLTRFSADLAHELRTPINNLRGEVEVAIGRSRTPEEYRETLGSCLEECVRLSQIIDSLLFLARAENPDTKIRREPLHIARELGAVKDYYEAAAAEKEISLELHAPPELTAQLDRTLLQRALGNLMDNALRHTPPRGKIRIVARKADGQVDIGVEDTGSGIRASDLPRVFDRFFRADPSRSTGTGGTGLGLAIVKGIAELHGGVATVESQPAVGTKVFFSVPEAAEEIKKP